jgi:hypothetical protein
MTSVASLGEKGAAFTVSGGAPPKECFLDAGNLIAFAALGRENCQSLSWFARDFVAFEPGFPEADARGVVSCRTAEAFAHVARPPLSVIEGRFGARRYADCDRKWLRK